MAVLHKIKKETLEVDVGPRSLVRLFLRHQDGHEAQVIIYYQHHDIQGIFLWSKEMKEFLKSHNQWILNKMFPEIP